jgi:hypothetical protein
MACQSGDKQKIKCANKVKNVKNDAAATLLYRECIEN